MYKHRNEKGVCYVIDEENNLFTSEELERIFYDTAMALSCEHESGGKFEVLGFKGMYDSEALYYYALIEMNQTCMKGGWCPWRIHTKEYSEQREQEVIKTLEAERGYKLRDVEEAEF